MNEVSFIYIKNSKGPIIEPWGTHVLTLNITV